MTIVTIDKNAVSVVSMLEKAKTWLATAVDATGPEEIAAAKAQIRTAEVYARELHLSKEIQDDAAELVRRAEYAVNRSIRLGQERGEIATATESKSYAGKVRQLGADYAELNPPKPSPSSFLERHEWNNSQGGISDLDVEPEAFEQAIKAAKVEGNLSRANVVRKVKAQQSPATLSRQQRADLIEDLAAQGYSSRQMPTKVGVSEETVRQIARDFDIEIPADRAVGRTRRINSAQIVENTATALEGLVMGVELIDYAAVDSATASRWAGSLTESMRALNRFVRLTKEQTHD